MAGVPLSSFTDKLESHVGESEVYANTLANAITLQEKCLPFLAVVHPFLQMLMQFSGGHPTTADPDSVGLNPSPAIG